MACEGLKFDEVRGTYTWCVCVCVLFLVMVLSEIGREGGSVCRDILSVHSTYVH